MRSRILSQRGVSIMLLAQLAALVCHPGSLSAIERPSLGEESETALAESLGVRFIEGSDSQLILERDGTEYVVDVATQSISETGPQLALAGQSRLVQASAERDPGARIFEQQCASCHGADGTGISERGTPDLTARSRAGASTQEILAVISNGISGTTMAGFSNRLTAAELGAVASYVQARPGQTDRPNIYEPADDFVYSLPTGRSIPKNSLYVNFSHRFAFNPAFSGAGLGNTLLGMDGFSISSFGFRFGVTDELSISAYRSPSIIGRPIEFMAAYKFLDEQDGLPLNASFRVSIDGQDNFRRNFTTNLEGIISRSVNDRLQLYVVPTASFGNRRLVSKPGALANRPAGLPGVHSFSIGTGIAVNIRPTVAVVAEVIPTLINDQELGIDRPAYAFGIQKQVQGHAFTLGVSNSPGTVVAQRAGTRATFLGDPSADRPSGLTFGFNLMRRLK